MASRNRFCRQYLQKVNAKCPQISDEKKSYFAGIALRFERLKISSKIKGNFKLDGNVLEISLQNYSTLRFERLKIIYLFKNQGK
jgi:hypothetical protein